MLTVLYGDTASERQNMVNLTFTSCDGASRHS